MPEQNSTRDHVFLQCAVSQGYLFCPPDYPMRKDFQYVIVDAQANPTAVAHSRWFWQAETWMTSAQCSQRVLLASLS